jgi:hypothetical protein
VVSRVFGGIWEVEWNKLTPDERVGIVNGDGADIGELLDLGSAGCGESHGQYVPGTRGSILGPQVRHLHFLDLVIGHGEAKLLHSGLDGIPSSQASGEVDISSHAEVGGVEDLVGLGVVEDRLGCSGCQISACRLGNEVMSVPYRGCRPCG